jgi:hypothetical protein
MTRARYGIRTNTGILPNWAPDPFDFRAASGAHVGNSNNLHALSIAYGKRQKLREYYLEQKTKGSRHLTEKYTCAIRRVESELAEMKACIDWVKANIPSEVEAAPGDSSEAGIDMRGRNTLNSLLRYSDEDSDDFYADVATRCRKAGLPVPTFSANFGLREYRILLSRPQFEEMFAIYKKASKDWRRAPGVTESAPTYLIARDFDAVGTGSEDNRIIAIRRLRDILSTYLLSSSKAKESKSAMVLITEDKLHEDITKDLSVATIYVGANVISSDEIVQYIKLYESQVRADAEMSAKDDAERAFYSAFSVPSDFVDQLAAGLGGLNMSKIKDYIASLVKDMFDMYTVAKSINVVSQSFRVSVKKDILDHQSDSDMATSLNIESRVPMISSAQYLTKKNSAWDQFNEQFGDTMTEVKILENKLMVMSRIEATHVAPVRVSATGTVELAFNGFGITWAPLRGTFPTEEEMNSLSLEFEEVFGDSPKMPDSSFEISETDAARLTFALGTRRDKLRADVALERKKAIPNLVFLYGEPGSGKSIFPDVMASELGLRLMVTSLTDIFLASGETQYRGQSERRLSEFVDLCRNTKNAVLLIDEFHKFFEDGSRDGGSYISTVTEKLQTAWNDHKSTYRNNNFYIVCTSNRPPSHFGGGPAAALMNRFEMAKDIPVPSNMESLIAFFTSDTMMTNLVNESTNPRVASKVYQMIKAYEKDDMEMVDILARSIEKSAGADVFHSCLLMPESCRLKFLESRSIAVPEKDPDKKRMSAVVDFIEGWQSTRDIFREMSEPRMVMSPSGHEIEISPLEQICTLLEDKMQWSKLTSAERDEFARLDERSRSGQLTGADAERYTELKNKRSSETDLYSRASMRQLNNMSEKMLASHNEFVCGKDAMPLNWKTFWLSANLTNWVSFSDEAQQSEAAMEDLRRSPTSEVDGWEKLVALSKEEIARNIGISAESFMTEENIRQREKGIFNGVKADSGIAEAVAQGLNVRADYIFKAAEQNLSLSGTLLQPRIQEWSEISTSQCGRVDGPILANFFDSLKRAHSDMASAGLAYSNDRTSEDAQMALLSASENIVQVINNFNTRNIRSLTNKHQAKFAAAKLSGTGAANNPRLEGMILSLNRYAKVSGATADIDLYLGDEATFDGDLEERITSWQDSINAVFNNARSQFSVYANIGEEVSDELALEALNMAKEMSGEPIAEDDIASAEDDIDSFKEVNDDFDDDFDVDPIPEGTPEEQPSAPEQAAPARPDASSLVVPRSEGAISAPVSDEEDESEVDRLRREREESGRNASSNPHIVTGGIDLTLLNVDADKLGGEDEDYILNYLMASGVPDTLKESQTVTPLVLDDVPDVDSESKPSAVNTDTQEEVAITEEPVAPVAEPQAPPSPNTFDLEMYTGAINGILGMRKALEHAKGSPNIIATSDAIALLFPELDKN